MSDPRARGGSGRGCRVRTLLVLAGAALTVPAARASDWTPASPPGAVSEIAVDRSVPNGAVFAVTAAGTYRSRDGGRSWTLLPGSPASSTIAVLAFDAHNPLRIMGAGCGARESEDGGDTWQDASAGRPAGCSLRTLVPDPKGIAAFLAGGSDGVFLAGFGPSGRVWSSISNGALISNGAVPAIAALTTQTTREGTRIVWAAAPDGKLFANSAGVWFDEPAIPAPPRSLSTCCGGLLAAATEEGAFQFEGPGPWQPSPTLAGFGVTDISPGTIDYAATDRGVFRGHFGWSPLSDGFPDGLPIRRVISDGSGTRVYALAGGVVYRFDYPPATLRLVDPADGMLNRRLSFTIAIDPPQPFGFDIVWSSSNPDVIAPGRVALGPLAPQLVWSLTSVGISAVPVTVTFSTDPDFGFGSVSGSVTVLNPLPVARQLYPASATAGSPGILLTVVGGDSVSGATFVGESTLLWNGSPRPSRLLNQPCALICIQVLGADITAADLATSGTARVTVVSPGPGGGESAPLAFEIIPSRAPARCASCSRHTPVPIPQRPRPLRAKAGS